jgi:hypothetical protein
MLRVARRVVLLALAMRRSRLGNIVRLRPPRWMSAGHERRATLVQRQRRGLRRSTGWLRRAVTGGDYTLPIRAKCLTDLAGNSSAGRKRSFLSPLLSWGSVPTTSLPT